MSSVETDRMSDLHSKFAELYDQEREICRDMAQFVIAQCDGEAASIRDFHRTMFGFHGDYDEFVRYEELETKVVGQACEGCIVLVDQTGKSQGARVGVIAPKLMSPPSDKPYRLKIGSDRHGRSFNDGKPNEYDGSIGIPFRLIEGPRADVRRTFEFGRADWMDLVSITAYAHHNFSTRIWEFVEAEQVHFGFKNVIKAASTLGGTALDKVAFFHERAVAEAAEDKS